MIRKGKKSTKEWHQDLKAVEGVLKTKALKEIRSLKKKSLESISGNINAKEFEKSLFKSGKLPGKEYTPYQEYTRIIDYGFGVTQLQKELAKLKEKYPDKFKNITFQTDPITQLGTWMISRGKWWDNTLNFHRLEENIVNFQNKDDWKTAKDIGYTQVSANYLGQALMNGSTKKLDVLADYMIARDLADKSLKKTIQSYKGKDVAVTRKFIEDIIEKLAGSKHYEKLDDTVLTTYNKSRGNIVLVHKDAKELYDRMWKTIDIETTEGYKNFVNMSHGIKRLIMYNPMFHGWNLGINAMSTMGLKGIPRSVDDPMFKDAKDFMLRQAEKEAWTKDQKEQIKRMSMRDWSMVANVLSGIKTSGKQFKGIDALEMPIDLTHPIYQVMVDYGFPLGVTMDFKGADLKGINKATGLTWKETINKKVGFQMFGKRIEKFSDDLLFQTLSPAFEATMFWRTFATSRDRLKKKHGKWSEGKLDAVAGRIAERIATTMSGKLHKLDLTKVADVYGRAGWFANHWTMSNFRTLMGMANLGNNLPEHETAGKILQGHFIGNVARWVFYKWLLSQAANMYWTGNPTWENEPARRDKVVVGINEDNEHYFVDLNRFVNDIWNFARPSGLTGGVAGAVIGGGLGKNGISAIVGGSVGAMMGAAASKPVSEFANKWMGMPHAEESVAPQMGTVWRKLNPLVTWSIGLASNLDFWTKKNVRTGDQMWTEQFMNTVLNTITTLSPINNSQVISDFSLTDEMFESIDPNIAKGLALGFWVSKSRKIQSYAARRSRLESDYRRDVMRTIGSPWMTDEKKKERREFLRKRLMVNCRALNKEFQEYIEAYRRENEQSY